MQTNNSIRQFNGASSNPDLFPRTPRVSTHAPHALARGYSTASVSESAPSTTRQHPRTPSVNTHAPHASARGYSTASISESAPSTKRQHPRTPRVSTGIQYCERQRVSSERQASAPYATSNPRIYPLKSASTTCTLHVNVVNCTNKNNGINR